MVKAVVIGTSFGGLDALKTILPKLPANFAAPVLVVLHIGDNNNDSFVKHLDNICNLQVKEADEKEYILPGTIYFAPPNYHMMVEDDESITLTTDPKVHHSRPSIDVLFESAAWKYKNKTLGVILTGLNQDGAEGLHTIKECGGMTIVESPDNAQASIMPMSSVKLVQPEYILKLEDIAGKIIKLVEEN